jgi:hypothetical protein
VSETLYLVAVEGRSLPREDVRLRFIDGTPDAPNVIASSSYYRRAIERGDVRSVEAPKPKKGS